jgi:hypothetical protein
LGALERGKAGTLSQTFVVTLTVEMLSVNDTRCASMDLMSISL